MKFLFFVILVLLFVSFPIIPFLITNLHNIGIYSFKDIYSYFKYKKYNLFTGYGNIVLFSASGSQVFGSGKTASMVNDVYRIYNRFNNKEVWDDDKKKFVYQKIHIISNVEIFGVDYIPFSSVNQFIDIDKYNFDSMDITIFMLDESGAIFNSRQFKDNISSDMLTRLLQSRKNKACLYMTSQRLQFTDKILREICSQVYECKKTWRIMKNTCYNALDLEYALNPQLVKPKFTRYWFATDNSFKRYNTYQLVEMLNKNYEPLSNEEILARRGSNEGSLENSTRIKRKYRPHKDL